MSDNTYSEGRTLEDTLLSYFDIFHSRNMVRRDRLFPLVDALMDHESHNIKKELDTWIKQIKASQRRVFHCPWCTCVFENPVTLTCGHTVCQECLRRKSGLIGEDCSEKSLNFCLLCGNNLFNEGNRSVNVILSDIITKLFPDGGKSAEAKKLGQSQLISQCAKKAVETFSVALHSKPKDYECLCLRSDAYLKLNLHYLALRDANSACELRPDLPDAFHRKAKILTEIKSWDDAVLQFLRCAALNPTRPRRDELTESLFRLFTSVTLTKLEEKVAARKIATNSAAEELQEGKSDTESIGSLSSSEEESSTNEQEIAQSSCEKIIIIEVAELQCYICGRLLFYPVTVQCGHTFCKECIKDSLEYGPKCPSCGTVLNDSKTSHWNLTVVLDGLLRIYLEEPYREREEFHSQEVEMWTRVGIDQNVEVPILVCTIVIPQGRMDLTLSHPSHRVMVRRSVEWGSQMFGICLPDEDKGFTDYGTIVEVQATASFPAGKLVVQAVPKRSFRVVTRSVSNGCPTAKVEWVEDAKIDNCDALLHLKWCNSLSHHMLKRWLATLPHDEKVCLENSLGPVPPCDSHLLLSPNGPPWLWWSMAAIPISAQEKLRILLMPGVADRLQSMQNYLEALLKSNNDQEERDVKQQATDGCHALTSLDSSFRENTVI